jgi:hypothetical protein
MNEIQIETKYNVEDYIRSYKFLQNLNKPSGFIINFGSLFICFFGFVNLFIAFVSINDHELVKAFLLMLMAGFVIYSTLRIISLYNSSIQLWTYQKNIENRFDENSVDYVERQLIFNEKGICETHKFGEYLTNWKGILKVVETDEDFYFYLHNSVRFQPKRDFTDEQLDPLRILIKSNLDEESVFEEKLV